MRTLVDQCLPDARGITTTAAAPNSLLEININNHRPTGLLHPVRYDGGVNPTLQSKKSKSATLWLLLEPTKNFSIGVDYFLTDMREAIRTRLSVETSLGVRRT